MKTDTPNYEALYGMLRDAVCGAMSEAPTGAPTIVQRAVKDRRTFADQRTELGKVRRLLFQLRQGIEHFRQAAGTVTALCVEIDANPAVTSCDIVDVVAAHDRQQEVAGVRLLRELGYEPCTAVACNCGSWHLSREGEERRDARDARLLASLKLRSDGERVQHLWATEHTNTARAAAIELHGYGYNVPKPVTEEWLVAAASKGMIRKADLVPGATYIGCCRNAYVARWYPDGRRELRVRWSMSFDGDEFFRSEPLNRYEAQTQVVGARALDAAGDDRGYAFALHAAACEDESCAGLDDEDGCTHPEPGTGVFWHLRDKFGNTFAERINHPEDDDGYDVFVPTRLILEAP